MSPASRWTVPTRVNTLGENCRSYREGLNNLHVALSCGFIAGIYVCRNL